MTAATDREVCFEPVELDLLATHAGADFPFPLRVPSFGRFTHERDELLADAGHALCARGLATGAGPVGVANELVTALREYRGAVDLVVVGSGGVIGAVAMVHRDRAVVCRQSPLDERGSAVVVTVVPATVLGDELARLIPVTGAAATMPITVPPGVVDETVADRLADVFPTSAGQGQLGVVRRVGDTVTRPPEVWWLDGGRGRVRVDRGDAGWVSVNPLRHSELLRLLGEAAEVARA
ncbi:ESX secretion-associated protein EspG [Saccharothrix sp. NRRL B-16314]|uniref:ESX secretion-associated protein EspG n=1 Tax=Saccharothrix sp. NRRL B-16314 TaxID=1463825 RepID=UPI0005260D04|nr:ESX secretion-associated protein EspG [Saccharothrix sp. NRRL B-16314]